MLISVIFVTILRVTKFSTHEIFHPRIFSRLLRIGLRKSRNLKPRKLILKTRDSFSRKFAPPKITRYTVCYIDLLYSIDIVRCIDLLYSTDIVRCIDLLYSIDIVCCIDLLYSIDIVCCIDLLYSIDIVHCIDLQFACMNNHMHRALLQDRKRETERV